MNKRPVLLSLAIFTGSLFVSLLYLAALPLVAQTNPTAQPNPLSLSATTKARWQQTSFLPFNVRAASTVASDTHLYVIGGYAPEGPDKFAYAAPILPTGELGEWDAIKAPPVSMNASGVVVVDNHIVTVWLPDPEDSEHTGCCFTYVANLLPGGDIGSWATLDGPPGLPRASQLQVNGNRLYAFTEYSPETGTVYRAWTALLQPNGDLSQWTEIAAPNYRYDSTFAKLGNRIYQLGGFVGSSRSALVEYADINDDGTLSKWKSDSSLTLARNSMGVASYGDLLIAFGGSDGFEITDFAEASRVDSTSGNLGEWTEIANLTVPRMQFGYAVSGSYAYAVGAENYLPGQERTVEWIDLSKKLGPPSDGKVSINNGATFTNQVSVTLYIDSPSSVRDMMVSNDGGFVGGLWEPFASTKTWAIAQSGVATIPRVVYVKFRTYLGEVLPVFQDDIILDVTAPHGSIDIEAPAAASARAFSIDHGPDSLDQQYAVYLPISICGSCPNSGRQMTRVILHLEAQDDASGVAFMQIGNSPNLDTAARTPFVNAVSWQLPTGGESTVYVRFIDNAGNISDPVHDTIVLP